MLRDTSIIIKGAGEMASGIAWRLYRSGFRNISMLEIDHPMAVRRRVCFCEAVYEGHVMVDGVSGVLCADDDEMNNALDCEKIPVVVDPEWHTIERRKPRIVIDAILAKRNLGTRMEEAPLVIGLGPGFTAGVDAHAVVETNRGPNCGRVLYEGCAMKNTGIPAKVMGFDVERVLRAPTDGLFEARVQLGDRVTAGDTIATVDSSPVITAISGVVRGLIRDGIKVTKDLKIGDMEPREGVDIDLVSDKSLGLGGAVLEAVLTGINH